MSDVLEMLTDAWEWGSLVFVAYGDHGEELIGSVIEITDTQVTFGFSDQTESRMDIAAIHSVREFVE